MKKIREAEYKRLLKKVPMRVKRTRNGYYLLGKNKWISDKKSKDKE